MELKWKGNQKYNHDISKATILDLDGPLKVSIHKIVGCGEEIYLSCYPLSISRLNLNTESWDEAEIMAITKVQAKAKELYDLAMGLTK